MTTLPADLAALLATVRRPGDFVVAGTAELLVPQLEVEGVGPVALPLLPVQAGQIAAVAEPAPYGRGAETVLDPAVRRCRQLGPDRVRIGGRHWARTLEGIVARAAAGLGVEEPVAAEFYKLLLYAEGDFFLGHRDTEKAPGMFATLVVALPSAFSGGELVVRHKGREARLELRPDDPAEVAFAAFYADCVHEVLPLTSGHRLILTYNMLRRGRGRTPQPPDYADEQARLAVLLRRWQEDKDQPGDETPEKLVYPLEHAYTPAELGFAALKGADAAAAAVLTAAAREAGAELHLALLTVEESGAAEYADTYGSRRGRWDDEEAFEAGEVDDRSMMLADWRHPGGGAPPLGGIPVDDAEFSPPDARDAMHPDEEHFREASGNEGASFERTYRRAALVLWPGGRTFAVLSQAGLRVTLPWLGELVRRWSEGGGDPGSPLQREALDLARHMLARWPVRGWYPRSEDEPGEAAAMLALLTTLDDAGLIERFLAEVTAAGCYGKGDNAAILGALGRLPPPRAAALVERIVSGTAGAAFGACANLLARAAKALGPAQRSGLAGAAARLVEALPADQAGPARDDLRGGWKAAPAIEPDAIVDLLTGLGAVDGALARRAVDHIMVRPRTFDLDAIVVPAVRALAGAGQTPGAAAVEHLREAAVAHLRARVAEPLAPPADWRREAALPCRCRRCGDLARFLADPEQRTWILKAAEADRRHVEDSIRRAKADLDATTHRRGSPYSLVCTKTQASYEKRAQQRRQDLEDLTLFGGG